MKVSRRLFFSKMSGAVVVGALAKLLPTSALAEERRRARGAGGDKASEGTAAAGGKKDPLSFPVVDPKVDPAKGVKYVHKHADLKDASVKIERQGVAFDKQICQACSFYNGVGKKEGMAVGTCTIFFEKLVSEQGFCTSWNKKS